MCLLLSICTICVPVAGKSEETIGYTVTRDMGSYETLSMSAGTKPTSSARLANALSGCYLSSPSNYLLWYIYLRNL